MAVKNVREVSTDHKLPAMRTTVKNYATKKQRITDANYLFFTDAEQEATAIIFKVDGKELKAVKNSKIYAFFPTAKEAHQNFYIHAPFDTTPARDNFKEGAEYGKHNIVLVKAIGELIWFAFQWMRDHHYLSVSGFNTVFTIREAKTDRDRYIPLSDSVKDACISYADKIWWEKDSDFFFLSPDKTMISPMTVYQRYRRYLEVAGISHGGKGQGPRLHDIRHTFAVHVLQKWIKEGADLTAMLPILSTYMGHKTVRATAGYLRLTAEVYPELMKRVEKSCAYVIPEVCHEGN